MITEENKGRGDKINKTKVKVFCETRWIERHVVMGAVILASAFLVLELGALVIYNRIKNVLTHAQRGGGWPGGGNLATLLNLP